MSYAVAVVNYRSYQDLRCCLKSVEQQSRSPAQVWVADADADPRQLEAARAAFPRVHWDPHRNCGFGAGANRILQRIRSENPEIDFVLILNPDVELDAEYAEVLLRAMEGNPDVALASGKLLRPDGLTIDSAGIVMKRHRRPRDRGSGTPDCGQYDQSERIFGVSGAAMLIRCDAAADLAVDGQVFDEDFFMYFEDTDLCWRANLLGWSVLYVPRARALHGRRWRRNTRMQVPRQVRRHSFKNHYLQIIKNERLGDLVRNLPVLLWWEFMRLGFALVRDPGVLPAYFSALRLAPRAWLKRRLIQERVRSRGEGASARQSRHPEAPGACEPSPVEPGVMR
jgi:GT2 family glycosyltransferase